MTNAALVDKASEQNTFIDPVIYKDELFVVGVSKGDRDLRDLLVSTIRGPFNYTEMIERVYTMWTKDLNHAKVLILKKDAKDTLAFLNSETIDYIIEKAPDILLEEAFNLQEAQ